MSVSEKGFLERLAEAIPGVRGYRDREARRETDRRLREFLAMRIEEGRRALDTLRQACADSGDLAPLDAIGRLDRTLQKTAAALRFAGAGYRGWLDQVRIREAELERIQAYDEALLGDVRRLEDDLRKASADGPERAALADLDRAARHIDDRVARRAELFEAPTE